MVQPAARSSDPPSKTGFFRKIFGFHNTSNPPAANSSQSLDSSPETDPSASVPRLGTNATTPPPPSLALSGTEETVGDSPSSSNQCHRRHASYDVVPGLPRVQTFKRQQSEQRTHLEPVAPTAEERRALSVGRGRSGSRTFSPNSNAQFEYPRVSAPGVLEPRHGRLASVQPGSLPTQLPATPPDSVADLHRNTAALLRNDYDQSNASYGPYAPSLTDALSSIADLHDETLFAELDTKWILNLSMHFRDRSKREKFFVTYRQESHTWRRVTISLDYRDAPPHSLEEDLANTTYQRDKIYKIYEAIRDSLPDIQFYDTVTNLKLQTSNGRLHVHVVEDGNEIISYPSINEVRYLHCRRVKERDIDFQSHMSGFVYKVNVDGQILIKKEIPSPDTIDEFRYEINSLNALHFSEHVIDLYGLVVDDEDTHVKGLLIKYADKGSLIDVLYDHREQQTDLPWSVRTKWAQQIVEGLAHVHETGYVQGDFTLSNIVIDDHGDAKIIDINRRGCPVGWEPPEAEPILRSGQRIAMYIGNKSDLYQLGMVLWSIAMIEDEPERLARPLTLEDLDDIPEWYRELTNVCLHQNPMHRLQATNLLRMFPHQGMHVSTSHHTVGFKDPVPRSSQDRERSPSEMRTSGRATRASKSSDWSYVSRFYVDTDPSDYEDSYYPPRGRSPPSPKPMGPDGEWYRRPSWSESGYGSRSYQVEDSRQGKGKQPADTTPKIATFAETPKPTQRSDGPLVRRSTGSLDHNASLASESTIIEPITPPARPLSMSGVIAPARRSFDGRLGSLCSSSPDDHSRDSHASQGSKLERKGAVSNLREIQHEESREATQLVPGSAKERSMSPASSRRISSRRRDGQPRATSRSPSNADMPALKRKSGAYHLDHLHSSAESTSPEDRVPDPAATAPASGQTVPAGEAAAGVASQEL